MSITVRSLTIADWPQLAPLAAAAGSGMATEAEQHAAFTEILASDYNLVLGAEHNGVLAGYLVAQDLGPRIHAGSRHRTARFHDLYVAADHRRMGAGRALMESLVAWARPRVRYVQWQAHETRAAPFYERLGYHGQACPQPDYPEFEIEF